MSMYLSADVPGSLPLPLQVGQESMIWNDISFSTPLAASRKSTFILYSLGCWWTFEKSNGLSPNWLVRKDWSPNIVLKSSSGSMLDLKFHPPVDPAPGNPAPPKGPPPAAPGPSLPKVSYCFLLLSSERHS